ncbi:tumor necrosis factor receptor superfamily member 5 [Nerophis ophidion]|uniref:tumor necrosis factor receptor superfamily member 5 n=1 Tax=Nerophis ophidion TaxID=159077 RepID=UPI002ADF9711|nr:tumor necrosis factor receptor superfamily member 5 [Nerophis ophidion]
MEKTLIVIFIQMWTLAVMTAGQLQCDPQTQYQQNGQCCQKCPPGTSMSSFSVCTEPLCLDCDEDEYQDAFTTEATCKRQPYCDPNKNFEFVKQASKRQKSVCMCQRGFHCSSGACLTCVPHRSCEPGWGAIVQGNQTHDTVCHKCPQGSFSNKSLWDADCVVWTKCENGYHVGRSGSDKSDVVCEKSRGPRVAIAIVVFPVVFVAFIAAIVVCLSRGQKEKKKVDISEVRVQNPLIENKSENEAPGVEVVPPGRPLVVTQPSSEDATTGVPEENKDDPSDRLLTVNGNYVMQENGKAEVLSCQESQNGTLMREMFLSP